MILHTNKIGWLFSFLTQRIRRRMFVIFACFTVDYDRSKMSSPLFAQPPPRWIPLLPRPEYVNRNRNVYNVEKTFFFIKMIVYRFHEYRRDFHMAVVLVVPILLIAISDCFRSIFVTTINISYLYGTSSAEPKELFLFNIQMIK